MCKRVVINAGIDKIVVRDTKDKYTEIPVQEYIDNDDSLDIKLGY
jgi:dCMP deaminase